MSTLCCITVDFSSVRTSRIAYSVWYLTRGVTSVAIHPFLHVWTVVGCGVSAGRRTLSHTSTSLCSNGTEIDCNATQSRHTLKPYIVVLTTGIGSVRNFGIDSAIRLCSLLQRAPSMNNPLMNTPTPRQTLTHQLASYSAHHPQEVWDSLCRPTSRNRSRANQWECDTS